MTMSENGELNRAASGYSSNGIGSRSLLPSDLDPVCTFRRANFCCGPHDGDLLPTDLSGANTKTGERHVLSHGERRPGGRFPTLSSMSSRKLSGLGGLAGNIEHRFTSPGVDRRG